MIPVCDLPSPNQDDRPEAVPVDMLILHYTGMQSAAAAVERLRDPAARVSSHYVVDEDGTVLRLVPEARRAWHAGVSFWRGHRVLNDRSVGIEIVNPGHEWGYRPFPPAQMAAVRTLCLGILARHPIPARNVLAHSDVAPDRKQDPGECFDWPFLAAAGIGLWPPEQAASTGAGGADEAARLLARIGYEVAPGVGGVAAGSDGSLAAAGPLATAIRAFQRHWHRHDLSGRADPATLARMRAVAAAMEAA